MRRYKSAVFTGLVAGSLIASTGFTADRDLLDDLKDRFERGRDQVERDRYDRDRDRDRDRYDRDRRADRRDRDGREHSVSGTVTEVNKKRNAFTIRERDNDMVTVVVPRDVSSRDRERFAELREGDRVRLAGRFDGENNTIRLEEFR